MNRRVVQKFYFRWFIASALIVALTVCCSPDNSKGMEVAANAPVSIECKPISLSPPRSSFTIQPGPLTDAAKEISSGAGKVIASATGTATRNIFVFEETHTSRIGQLEIALMLLRLHKRHNLRLASLEGAIFERGELPVKWFHDLNTGPGNNAAQKYAAVRLLREGEINSGEFIALALADMRVKGNEKAEEYDVKPPEFNPLIPYLIGIAEKSLTQDQIMKINDSIRAQNKEEMRKLLFESNAWVKERYDKLRAETIMSAEELILLLQEIEAKASKVGARVDEKQRVNMQDDLTFFQIASKRSCTMVKNTYAMSESNPKAPVALIVGAAHTEKVVEALKAAKASFAVISPLSLGDVGKSDDSGKKVGSLTNPAYKRKLKQASVDAKGYIGSLLAGGRKPAVVVREPWFHSKAEIYYITRLIAKAARDGQSPLPKLENEIRRLQSIVVVPGSFRIIKNGSENRAMFKVTAKVSNDGKTVNLWVGTWMDPRLPSNFSEEVVPDLEKLVETALDDERKGPLEDVSVDKPVKPGEIPVLQISTDVKAAFSTEESAVEGVLTSG